MNDTSSSSSNNWPPPNNNRDAQTSAATNNNNQNNQSFLAKLVTCGGICSVEALRPYFDVDTADIFVRMKGSLRYCNVVDGFRNEVLYSDNALRLAYRSSGGEAAAGGDTNENSENEATTSTATSSGKGPDLYGPIWITLTLVFFVAVTSNMSLYIHHHKKNVVDEGGIAAEEEWDYDINQLLHATWILYSFSIGLPTLFYFVLRLVGVGVVGSGSVSGSGQNSLGLVELICLYGYSLVPYLPVTWLCVVSYGWMKWLFLAVATVVSGMLVLRNVVRPILESSGGGMGMGMQGGKSGGLIMCLVACHFVFFLVMKLAFYHHS